MGLACSLRWHQQKCTAACSSAGKSKLDSPKPSHACTLKNPLGVAIHPRLEGKVMSYPTSAGTPWCQLQSKLCPQVPAVIDSSIPFPQPGACTVPTSWHCTLHPSPS